MKSFSDLLTSFKAASSGTSGAVGIDIGSSSIKVVELQEKDEVLTLTTYGELQLGPYGGVDLGDVVQLDAKAEQEALVDVIRESAVSVRNAVFAMPLSSSFVTNVSIEAEANADLAPMVRVEARKVIPASLSEVTLDWAEVERPKNDDAEGNRRDVLIAAIQNVALERFKVLMKFAGFQQPPTEIECFSAIRGLYNVSQPNTVIIDIGATSTKLYIGREALLMRMHRVRAGGTTATKQIAKALDLSFAEAEELKQMADSKHEKFSDLKRAHNASYERAFREFNQVLREYEHKTGHEIDLVHLTGGGSLFPGMKQMLKEALGKEIEFANPFTKVAYPAFMEDTVKAIGPSFAVALGAALRDFE
jgi:type IV pilus assembly protein PilM